MRNRYEIWLSTDKGVRLALIDDWLEVEYTIIEHDIGVVSLTLRATSIRRWYTTTTSWRCRGSRRDRRGAGDGGPAARLEVLD